MQPLQPLKIPLFGKNLIQASAGTGKTWTISLLYVRLIVERLLTVDQLLVVTYTRAATEELRGRIRARLKEALAAYEQPDTATAEYRDLFDDNPPSEERTWYLRRALLSFDEAAVFTIHGFCQRVLQQHAFEVGLPFESELINSEAELQLALTDQFWQQRLVQANALDTAVLKAHKLTPDSLLADISTFIGKPYLEPKKAAHISPEDYLQASQTHATLRLALEQSWLEHKTEVLDTLLHSGLSKASYKEAQITKMARALDALFAGESPKDLNNKDLDKELLKFTPEQLAAKTNKGKQAPEHPFFAQVARFLPHHTHLASIEENALDQLRYDLLLWLRTQLPERKRQQGVLAFDDLLVNLQDALAARPGLGDLLASQYRVALIDEFQDTDPVQFQVFKQIYQHNDGQVYYVGDPKQAIYSFRGADIYTYLQAADSVAPDQQYTLDRNFRSQPRLLAAFNHLYAPSADPFRNQRRIDYERVEAGGTVSGELACTPALAPLRLWDWDGSRHTDEKAPGKPLVFTQVAQAVAADIARLLAEGQQGTARIAGKALTSGDFAVLVRSHKQGRMIKEALQTNGIASVQKSPLGIFQTAEAAELRVVLAAIAEPGNMLKVRRALVTELMGGNAASLLTMDAEQEQLDSELEAFYSWHQLWQSAGFMRMFRTWMDKRRVRNRLLTYLDGERRLTNLLHLGELIHTETRHRFQGMQATLRWLQGRARENSEEEHQLRLESDENLVQIVTIHKSKGLQYPIVYCPFLWSEKEQPPSGNWFAWHDASTRSSCLQAGKEGLEQARLSRLEEDRSENLRLLYVALTRAQYQCTVVLASGEIAGFNYASALGWLLFGHLPEADKLLGTKSSLPAAERQQQMHAELAKLVAKATGTIDWHSLPVDSDPADYHAPAPEKPLRWREFQRKLPPIERIGSFSGLTFGKHDERPDYDQSGQSIELSAPRAYAQDLAVFPGGQRAGVCLHKMFERADFCLPLAAQMPAIIERSLQESGFDLSWAPAAQALLQRALDTPLLPAAPPRAALTLADIPKTQRLDEMEFYFPVRHLKVRLLQKILLHYLPDDWEAIRAAVMQLTFNDLQGYMKGFIDLVFQANGQFYIVDYKSNWLGDNAEDYAQASLANAMAAAHYYLQYLIYSVAVHRYLKQRVPDYQWETHVGGVLYLFLRGMQPDSGQMGNGVFFHKPSVELIDALDGLMEL